VDAVQPVRGQVIVPVLLELEELVPEEFAVACAPEMA
jgi:hypothetical protein